MKRFVFLWCLLILSFRLVAQSDTDQTIPEPRTFNVGISTGAAGLHWFLKPVLEIKIKNTSFRATPGFFYRGYAIEQEFTWKHSEKFSLFNNPWGRNNIPGRTNLTVTAQYQNQFDDFCIDLCNTANYNQFISLLAGLKSYKGRKFTSAKIGIIAGRTRSYSINDFNSNVQPGLSHWVYPFAEFSMGIYLLKE